MTKSIITEAISGVSLARLPAIWKPSHRFDLGTHSHEYAEPYRLTAATSPELHVHQLLGILRRRSILIIAMAIVGAMLASAAAVLVPPKFTARAQIVVESNAAAARSGDAFAGADVSALAIDTKMTMLAARDHLRAVLASLTGDPKFAPIANIRQPGSKTTAIVPGATPLQKEEGFFTGLEQKAAGWFARFRTTIGRIDAIPTFDEFERTLRIDQERRSRVITVRYSSNNPTLAAAIANRVVELYVQNETDRIKAASRTELDQLNARIAELQRMLAAADKTVRQKLATMQNSANARQLFEIQLRQIEREINDNEQLYASLLKRQKQLRNQPDTTETSVRILSLATPPETPSSLDPKFLFLPAIILALIGGGVLAVVFERFDRTLRSEHQVQGVLGLGSVALVPKLGWIGRTRAHEDLQKKPFSPYAESIRSIVASLKFSTDQQAPQIVLLSSSVRGEGKTTLATSLAVYATRLHRRVLLIDLDFRHASVMRTLKLKADSGILDLIVSNKSVDEVVQHVPKFGLDVLPMPSCPVDPVTLFADGDLQNVLQEIRKNYDFVVIDGPPLLGVTESSLLASLADTVLFVVKWGSTRRDVAQNALGELRALGWSDEAIAERVRAVVTQVHLKQHARYQYGDAVELVAKHRNYSSPTQKVKSLTDMRKTDDHLQTLAHVVARRTAAE